MALPQLETGTLISRVATTTASFRMCLQVVEIYAHCGCFYHQHAVDPCPARNTPGHRIRVREVPVGYACNRHAAQGPAEEPSSARFPDSGYSSYYSSSHYRGKY